MLAQGKKTVADFCRALYVSQPTYHRWRQQYGGMQGEETKRLTQLEKENARLKKLLAEVEAQGLADLWLTQALNTLKPHSALQGRRPLEAAQQGAAA